MSVSASTTSFQPGSTITLTINVNGNGASAGFFLSASSGRFSLISGQGTRMVGTEDTDVAHSAPKLLSGGKASFQVRWTAPTTPGNVEFEAYSVLANNNNNRTGDSAKDAFLPLVFGCNGISYYRDWDLDGVGSAASGTTLACSTPAGYATDGGDCDDFDMAVFPGAPESCNQKDDNCNGMVDEGLSSVASWPDADHDGYGDSTAASMTGCSTDRVTNKSDCNDRDAQINPMGIEVCNAKDDDCDGQVDEGIAVSCGVGRCEVQGPSCDIRQCVPLQPIMEQCNFIDDDCDGQTDEGQLCPAGQACLTGQCTAVGSSDAGRPGDSGQGDAGQGGSGGAAGSGGGSDANSGLDPWTCAGVSPWFLVPVIVERLRRRSAPKSRAR